MDHKRFNRAKAAREGVAFQAMGTLRGVLNAEWLPPYMRDAIVSLAAEYDAITAEMEAALIAPEPTPPLYEVKEIEAEQAALRG